MSDPVFHHAMAVLGHAGLSFSLFSYKRYSHNSADLADSLIHLTEMDTTKINTISSYDSDLINGEKHMLDKPYNNTEANRISIVIRKA